MRAFLLPLAVILALATGLGLLRLSDLATETPPWPVSARAEAHATLVRDFYDAVNVTLRSGDPAGLAALLATDFVEHGGPPGLPATRAGFVQFVLALHVTAPVMQIRAQDVLAVDDVVVAHVRVDVTAERTFLGLPLIGSPATWGTVDVFRVRGGEIVAHWGGRADAPLLEPLHEVPLDQPLPDLQIVALERTTTAPGVSVVADGFGPEAIYVEDGHLRVAVAADARGVVLRWPASPVANAAPAEIVTPGSTANLAPGDLLLFSHDSRGAIRSVGDVAARFLRIAVRAPGSARSAGAVGGGAEAAAGPPATAPGPTTANLAGHPLTALPSGQSWLGLGRAVLVPGASLPVTSAGVALFAVEAGNLTLANIAGTVWRWRGADGVNTTATDGVFGVGDAVVVEPGAGAELHNAGDTPLVLLVVTIAPVAPEDRLPTASPAAGWRSSLMAEERGQRGNVVHRAGPLQPRARRSPRGSSASRSRSPSKLRPRIRTRIARAGIR